MRPTESGGGVLFYVILLVLCGFVMLALAQQPDPKRPAAPTGLAVTVTPDTSEAIALWQAPTRTLVLNPLKLHSDITVCIDGAKKTCSSLAYLQQLLLSACPSGVCPAATPTAPQPSPTR